MMNSKISKIKEAIKQNNLQQIKTVINAIIEEHKNTFNFEVLHATNTFNDLWEILFICLSLDNNKCIYKECLMCIRLLSRDKTHLNEIITANYVNILLQCANLNIEDTLSILITTENTEFIIEGLKILCNIVYNSKAAQEVCCNNKTVDSIIFRLRTYFEQNIPYDIKYFDLKLLFLLTAFKEDIRIKVREKLHGLIYLTELLENLLCDPISSENFQSFILEENVSLSCEILKILFNLTSTPGIDSSEGKHYSIWIKLVSILCNLLVKSTFFPLFEENIFRNTVNLLTNAPSTCLDQLLIANQWSDIKPLKVIIDFLDNQLSSTDNSTYEKISPSLIVLLKGSRSIAKFRREVRYQILPPLKDVTSRPEHGITLRNKLCRLLTAPNGCLQDLVSELLFVLCKENVSRMIKYTEFSNAAGLFANRGLFHNISNPEFSSDSEDSETEEYQTFKDQINPLYGCCEPPIPNPFEHMSDEQKENEVMKLVSKMDKLVSEGVIRPCKIGDDGRPKPFEHVLQLQEETINHFKNNDDSDE